MDRVRLRLGLMKKMYEAVINNPQIEQQQKMQQELAMQEHQANMKKSETESIENLTNARHNAAQEAKLQQEINLTELMGTIPPPTNRQQ